MILHRVRPPGPGPVSLAELKAHLRREPDETAEDGLLGAYLEAATAELDGAAGALGRCLLTQEWAAYADGPEPLPGLGRTIWGARGFALDLPPVRTDLTVSVEVRRGGAWTPVDDTLFAVLPGPDGTALLALTPGSSWPLADAGPRAWRMTFWAGYGDDPADVPAPIRAAILLLAADLDGNRDGKVVANLVDNPTIGRLLAPYRRITV